MIEWSFNITVNRVLLAVVLLSLFFPNELCRDSKNFQTEHKKYTSI